MSANIFAQYLQPVRSVQDYMADMDKRDLAAAQLQNVQRQNALATLSLQDQQGQIAQRTAENNAIRQAAATAGGDRQRFLAALDATGLPGVIKQAQDLRKQDADLETAKSTAAKNNAEAGKTTAETKKMNLQQALQHIGSLATPADAATSIQTNQNIDDATKAAMIASIPQDASGFQMWKAQQVLRAASPEQQAQAMLPKVEYKNTGKQMVPVDVNPLTTPKPQTLTMTTTPGEDLQSATSIKTTGMNNATSRANNAATIAKDLTVAGINPDGSPNANVEKMAQAIAAGKAAPITGFALAKPQGQTVMRRVFELNPNYDETTYGAKAQAAKAFTSGSQGNALRSVSTASAHLDQLGELADAMNNGNLQIANKVGNYFATQTGNPQATNFDAIKNIVGQEVVKAIVAGGGSAGERDEAAKAFSDAASPKQLKGAIEHYRMVMKAQADNLLAQRRAAGLTDETLPNYNSAGGQPSGGWSYVGPAGKK